MNCDLARLLLALTRPVERPGEGVALAEHLATCGACRAWADAQLYDTRVADAMRAVPPPPHGRPGAVRAVERVAHQRRQARVRRVGGIGTAIAMVIGLGIGTAGRLRPDANGDRIAGEAGHAVENPEAEVRAYLAASGLPLPPFDFDYAHHLNHGRMPILGTDAPAVTFVVLGPNGRRETATAYALSPNRFLLKELPAFAQASFYNVTVLGPDAAGLKWAVVHTTPDLGPFQRRPDRPDA